MLASHECEVCAVVTPVFVSSFIVVHNKISFLNDLGSSLLYVRSVTGWEEATWRSYFSYKQIVLQALSLSCH